MKRTRDMYKQHKKALMSKNRKAIEERSIPSSNIDAKRAVVTDCIKLDKKYTVDVLSIGDFKRHSFVVKMIPCPICGEALNIDEKWSGFICECHGTKKIWEVLEVIDTDGNKCN